MMSKGQGSALFSAPPPLKIPPRPGVQATGQGTGVAAVTESGARVRRQVRSFLPSLPSVLTSKYLQVPPLRPLPRNNDCPGYSSPCMSPHQRSHRNCYPLLCLLLIHRNIPLHIARWTKRGEDKLDRNGTLYPGQYLSPGKR